MLCYSCPTLQQFPYPPTSQDPFLAQLGFSLSLLLMLAFIYTFSQIVKVLYYVCSRAYTVVFYLKLVRWGQISKQKGLTWVYANTQEGTLRKEDAALSL